MSDSLRADFETLGKLIEQIEIGLLTTLDPDGRLHTRPVQTLRYDVEGVLWFFTDCESAKAEELRQHTRASVAYAHLGKRIYVAIEGSARVLRDRRRAAELWSPIQRAWYPQGVEDPRLGVLEVRVERAEWWLTPGRASYVLAAARSMATGAPATVGENVKIP